MSWDNKFMELANFLRSWSKDPSSKVGAVIADPETHRVIGLGYNGLPKGIDDDKILSREEKLSIVVHAEVNALLNSNGCVYGMTLYSTHQPCSQCAAKIINAGIKRVVFNTHDDFDKRWGHRGSDLLKEAGIEVCYAKD